MRAAPCLLLLACLAVGLAGCQSAGKRGGGGDNSPFAPAGGSKNKTPPAAPKDPILEGTPDPDPDVGGLLAGQVLDALTGRPVEANIRWACLDEKEEPAPIDVATNARGYFMIQGLKPGKQYKLVAKAKTGDRALAGVQYTVAPNPSVVIKLKDDLAAPAAPNSAPPPPAPPRAAPKEPEKDKDGDKKAPDPLDKSSAAPGPKSAVAEAPGWAPTVAPVAVPQSPRIGTPVPVGADGTAPGWGDGHPPPPPPTHPERIAVAAPTGPPQLVVPAGPVPSCVYVGRQLKHLALPDLDGRPWEYPRQKRGKLLLLDFWSTGCEPCLKSIPQLRALQERYGAAGLEVVGVAYEHGGSHAEQAQRVRAAAHRMQINYRMLLGAGSRCPVRAQFDVNLLPTLVLVTPNGWVDWRHEGRMEPHHHGELERRIKMWLGAN